MKPSPIVITGLAALAGLAAFAHYKAAAADAALEAAADGSAVDESAWGNFDVIGLLSSTIEGSALVSALTDQDTDGDNVRAFLTMLSVAEGTNRAADPYRVCYGYAHTIVNLAEHPANTGEWMGEPLDNLGPGYAGKFSTAAGRYQIIRPTWIACRNALRLPDFGPQSQDAAALRLVSKRGALEDVQAGRIGVAIAKCAPVWASLPGSTSGQPQRRMVALLDAFNNAGGSLA